MKSVSLWMRRDKAKVWFTSGSPQPLTSPHCGYPETSTQHSVKIACGKMMRSTLPAARKHLVGFQEMKKPFAVNEQYHYSHFCLSVTLMAHIYMKPFFVVSHMVSPYYALATPLMPPTWVSANLRLNFLCLTTSHLLSWSQKALTQVNLLFQEV